MADVEPAKDGYQPGAVYKRKNETEDDFEFYDTKRQQTAAASYSYSGPGQKAKGHDQVATSWAPVQSGNPSPASTWNADPRSNGSWQPAAPAVPRAYEPAAPQSYTSWQGGPTPNQPSAPTMYGGSGIGNNMGGYNIGYEQQPVAAGSEASKMCQCGIPCPLKTSQSAANAGRGYFACPKPAGDTTRCRYFEWEDGHNSLGARPAVPTTNVPGNDYGDRTYNAMPTGDSGGAGKGNCFKCNQPGHWSRDCPNKLTAPPGASFGGGAGGGGRGGECFICGQPGHWSRDCPTKSAGGGSGYGRGGGGGFGGDRGGGGGSFGGGDEFGGGGVRSFRDGYRPSTGGGWGGSGGGSGNCFKCGQPGHFSSSCPNKNA